MSHAAPSRMLIVLGCIVLAVVLGGAAIAVLVAVAEGSDNETAGGNGRTETETTASTPSSTLAPAPATPGECVSVTRDGGLHSSGSCVEGSAPYRVLEVYEGRSCPNPESSSVKSGAYTLCLEVNLVRNYCYSIPQVGWIQPAECEVPGTVHVIDVVPGVEDDTSCTTEFEWNGWYAFESPKMVACVKQY